MCSSRFRKFLPTSIFDFSVITNPNRVIFDSTDRSLSLLSKNTFSLISHLNSSSNLTKFQNISQKYLNSLWIQPVFTIIPLNSLLIPQIGKFGIIFDTRPCEIDDLAVSSRQVLVCDNISSRAFSLLNFLILYFLTLELLFVPEKSRVSNP